MELDTRQSHLSLLPLIPQALNKLRFCMHVKIVYSFVYLFGIAYKNLESSLLAVKYYSNYVQPIFVLRNATFKFLGK